MNVGIPTEIKSDEQRVSLTPAGVAALRAHDPRVTVQAGAGIGSGFADSDYRKAGASIKVESRRPARRRSTRVRRSFETASCTTA